MFKHQFPFDPTYGFTLNSLLAFSPPETEPNDLDSFWLETYKTTLSSPLDIQINKDTFLDPRWTCKQLFFKTLHGTQIGGWLFVPTIEKGWRFWKKPVVKRAFIYGHGYGGREKPIWPPKFSDSIHFYLCFPGFALSASEKIPSIPSEHVQSGIEQKETYLIRECVASIWSSVQALLELYPEVENKIYYSGTSFGGGVGAMALAYEKNFQKAHLVVPTFGHHPFRLSVDCTGSGDSLKQYVSENPSATTVLAYYDAALLAKRIQLPVLTCPALFDPAVPPPGQFAIYNALPETKSLFVFSAGHFEYAAKIKEYRQMDRLLVEWFS